MMQAFRSGSNITDSFLKLEGSRAGWPVIVELVSLLLITNHHYDSNEHKIMPCHCL
ncbi:hypothetical protein EXN66_Car019431 [Channa argus]|uniref:Uncharacterized protein n=1 Tax=Channa argus TaxID=215402 RepID=A0A6G1QN74_CHAAH|nr:hypothetical protein EXN66_Car019431 [Channa argus]